MEPGGQSLLHKKHKPRCGEPFLRLTPVLRPLCASLREVEAKPGCCNVFSFSLLLNPKPCPELELALQRRSVETEEKYKEDNSILCE